MEHHVGIERHLKVTCVDKMRADQTRKNLVSFEMYDGAAREAIGNHEEGLFDLAGENETRFPELRVLWAQFYKSPRVSSEQAGTLVHELIDLLSQNRSNKALTATVMRLLPFFSAAYTGRREIRCSSD